ncbi:MAG TPA: hypothetical protein EYM37_04190 [Methylophaga aminisulfidivorans]|uniref:hypothetical protein n=1 Tax=Methylophaga TaxID=40222 RepID=UPI001766DEF0|nr:MULTISPECIES: hypothetical protein [Methylophaga]HIC47815.1 hypothetical protein [Methylophaga sp.]HIM39121.1 hypothetical protein [Methylophaga aminisulfidivorans]
MHNQLKSGLFIALFLCTMGVSYAAEDRMDPAALENAMKSCRDIGKNNIDDFDRCMEEKGFPKPEGQHNSPPPPPPRQADPKIEAAKQACRQSAQGSVDVFDMCMQKKGFNKLEGSEQNLPTPSEPPKEVDPKLNSAIKECHETTGDNLAAFESCMQGKGFNKPRIETPN